MFTCIAVSALLVTVEWFWPMAGLPREYCSPRIVRPVLNGSGLFYQSLVAHLNSINSESDFWIDSHRVIESSSHQEVLPTSDVCYSPALTHLLDLSILFLIKDDCAFKRIFLCYNYIEGLIHFIVFLWSKDISLLT